MQTGVISFCDRIAYNIKSVNVKEDILLNLDKQYGLKIIQKQWHRLDENGSIHITRSPHWVCLRSNGNPYFVLFSKYEDVNQIFFIDKKIQPNYHVPRIILGRGQFDDEMFNNTLIDGEMVKDSRGQWVFLINDIIGHNGCSYNLNRTMLPERIKIIFELFNKKYVQDSVCDICVFQVKKYFNCTVEGLTNIQEFAKTLPYTNRGVYFYPHNLKYKPKLHNFDDSLIKSVIRKVKDVPDFKETITHEKNERNERNEATSITEIKQNPETCNEKSKKMYIKKTGESDVYDLYETPNSKTIGIAYIPTMQISKKMRMLFKDETIAVFKEMYCEYNDKFQKWIPCLE